MKIIERNHFNSYKHWYVRRRYQHIFIHTQLGYKMKNFFMLIRHRVIVVKFHVYFFHILSKWERKRQLNFFSFISDCIKSQLTTPSIAQRGKLHVPCKKKKKLGRKLNVCNKSMLNEWWAWNREKKEEFYDWFCKN